MKAKKSPQPRKPVRVIKKPSRATSANPAKPAGKSRLGKPVRPAAKTRSKAPGRTPAPRKTRKPEARRLAKTVRKPAGKAAPKPGGKSAESPARHRSPPESKPPQKQRPREIVSGNNNKAASPKKPATVAKVRAKDNEPAFSSKTPRQLRYRMPAEWEPHFATWLTWPAKKGISFPGKGAYEAVLPTLFSMVRALLTSEEVFINVSGEEDKQVLRDGLTIAEQRRTTSSTFQPSNRGVATTDARASSATRTGPEAR